MTSPTHRKDTKTKATNTDGSDNAHQTILFNCNCHTFESVIDQLIYAVECSYGAARRFAHIAHTSGQVTVKKGSQEECDLVADKLAEIGLKVRVT